MAEKFNPQKFIRIHRSTIAHLHHVCEVYRDIGKTFIVMNNGPEFNVGRSFLPLIKKLMV
ncbi:LytTR family transcriptional regulator [Sphingobacterium phlebotomi]|uniref:LytTR family transcriptional regulator n=1 Tax=Sphingobacterium phlebotomi TaxID=2605433 RepID=A0A5D4HFF9_9SPHI|nr:LytTR family transcriptional regulator [Sphingobacterium phlebotomi]